MYKGIQGGQGVVCMGALCDHRRCSYQELHCHLMKLHKKGFGDFNTARWMECINVNAPSSNSRYWTARWWWCDVATCDKPFSPSSRSDNLESWISPSPYPEYKLQIVISEDLRSIHDPQLAKISNIWVEQSEVRD